MDLRLRSAFKRWRMSVCDEFDAVKKGGGSEDGCTSASAGREVGEDSHERVGGLLDNHLTTPQCRNTSKGQVEPLH